MPPKTSKQKSSSLRPAAHTSTQSNGARSNGIAKTSSGQKSSASWKDLGLSKKDILRDYEIAHQSRLASVLGRREVLTGKAKFGIFGDGKEVPQVALAHFFRDGDWRSGYYRDQTMMFAAGISNVQEFFAQLYAHPDIEAEPASGGRMMNGHFATRSLNEDGNWKDLTKQKNSSADISPTGGQMPRLLGLAYASKLYRELPELKKGFEKFSHKGDEVAFGTIGNASTSEGLFFEAINAAAVLQVPMVMSVWDDGYGISVPSEFQTCKQSISLALKGFETNENGKGFRIYTIRGWDYPALVLAYKEAVQLARKEYTPVLIHVTELTQPQGHSTSGSHERYKSKERLDWEKELDCIPKMREWIIANKIATASELDKIEANNKQIVDEAKDRAWKNYLNPIQNEVTEIATLIRDAADETQKQNDLEPIVTSLEGLKEPVRKDVYNAAAKTLRIIRNIENESVQRIIKWKKKEDVKNAKRYSSDVVSLSKDAATGIAPINPEYTGSEASVDGRQVLQACFDAALARDSRVFAIGEDIGAIGDVNKAFEDLQAKYGNLRVTDTGIREATILGQGIGAAMRGLRPIVEIQYLDYLLFALETMSDDLATLRWRTAGGQKAPVIIRTRGHRLEGVWHSGSPMGMILNAVRGMYVLVPRNMTQAAGFYNTMLKSDDSALIVEVLNGYRLKEKIPSNIGEFTVPIGIPEVLKTGTDLTIVTYGACCRIATEASAELEALGISAEVIDVQTLLPFDVNSIILESLKKTNRILFLDEDVPGGASAFMMQKVLEEQNGYRYLDSKPVTLTAREHRPAYGSDGDFFSKPSLDDVVDACYDIMHESDPIKFPSYT